jgi:hypothetical protein
VVDEGASTCVMSLECWKAIGQPFLSLSPTLLMTFDGHLFQTHGIIHSFAMKLGGNIVYVKVEVVDATLDYNVLIGRSWTYVMHAMVMIVFWVLLFPHEGQIVSIDQLFFSYPDPSSGASTVSMIDNPQPDIVNIEVGLCPPLMGTFNYPAPINDVKYISTVPNQPRAEIFQVSMFRTTHFYDLWILPSPSSTMEGAGNHGMAMPLCAAKVAYSIVQQDFVDPDPTPAQELDLVLEPIWAQGSLVDTDSLDLVFPLDKVIIEAMTGLDRPWDDLHYRSFFLPELRRIEAGEFTLTMNGDRSCPINPLGTHVVSTKGNMETISKMIPIDISRTLGIMENVFIGAECSPKEIQIYTSLFK